MAVIVAVAVAVAAVGVVVEEDQAHDIGKKAEAADNADQLGIPDLLDLHQTLNCLQKDRHAKGN
jgi:hypothetical protein